MSLADMCANWDGSLEQFAKIVGLYISLAGPNARKLADEFDGLPSAPSRWASGDTKLRTKMQELVVSFIKKSAENV